MALLPVFRSGRNWFEHRPEQHLAVPVPDLQARWLVLHYRLHHCSDCAGSTHASAGDGSRPEDAEKQCSRNARDQSQAGRRRLGRWLSRFYVMRCLQLLAGNCNGLLGREWLVAMGQLNFKEGQGVL